MQLKVIARIRSDFSSKFGIPRQSGLVDELGAFIIFLSVFHIKLPPVVKRIFPPTRGISLLLLYPCCVLCLRSLR